MSITLYRCHYIIHHTLEYTHTSPPGLAATGTIDTPLNLVVSKVRLIRLDIYRKLHLIAILYACNFIITVLKQD